MVKIIAGGMGTGKTKRMIQMANEMAKTSDGNIIFIDDDNRNIFELDHKVRFINLEEYSINTAPMLYGFVCGLMSSNFDIDTIFVDGLAYLNELKNDNLEKVIDVFNEVSEKQSVTFVICFNHEGELPEHIKQMQI